MVVGMVAILEAGGVYVPLDPSHPPERLALLLADSRAPVLLTHRRLAALLPAGGARLMTLDGADAPVPRGGELAAGVPGPRDGELAADVPMPRGGEPAAGVPGPRAAELAPPLPGPAPPAAPPPPPAPP